MNIRHQLPCNNLRILYRALPFVVSGTLYSWILFVDLYNATWCSIYNGKWSQKVIWLSIYNNDFFYYNNMSIVLLTVQYTFLLECETYTQSLNSRSYEKTKYERFCHCRIRTQKSLWFLFCGKNEKQMLALKKYLLSLINQISSFSWQCNVSGKSIQRRKSDRRHTYHMYVYILS